MGDGTKANPFTREDVLRLIEENGGTAEGLDLSGKVFEKGIDLRGLNLNGIILKEATLEKAHLEGAKLIFANLEGAHLEYAHLKGARLMSANLEGAHLEYAHLKGAHLIVANLEGAHLISAHLEQAVLLGAHLNEAYLPDAHLERANLHDAHLEGASLYDAHLEKADLTGAHLEGAYLYRTKFSADTRLGDADWGSYIVGEEKDGLFEPAVAVYRQLKMWYTQAGYADIAAKFYYREMEAKRKALKLFSRSSWRHRLALEFIYRGWGYGEGWKRILFGWIPGLILLFALIYFGIGTLTPNTFLSSLYYSAVSFTALGYGSWVKDASGWVKGLGAFEALVGVSMMALLLVTFVRKWTR